MSAPLVSNGNLAFLTGMQTTRDDGTTMTFDGLVSRVDGAWESRSANGVKWSATLKELRPLLHSATQLTSPLSSILVGSWHLLLNWTTVERVSLPKTFMGSCARSYWKTTSSRSDLVAKPSLSDFDLGAILVMKVDVCPGFQTVDMLHSLRKWVNWALPQETSRSFRNLVIPEPASVILLFCESGWGRP